jgi:hypothetical protein
MANKPPAPNRRPCFPVAATPGFCYLLCAPPASPAAVGEAQRSGHGNALLAISAASAISAREKRNAQRRRGRRGRRWAFELAMDGESAPTTHAPNQAAPVNAPVAFWFHAGRTWRQRH